MGHVKVAVFTVVNAIGAIVDRDGRVVRGHLDPATGRREPIAAELDRLAAEIDARPIAPVPGNTTVTLLVTNAALDARELRQLGRQVHDSMARAIQPFHTPDDGDVLFAVTTAEVTDSRLGPTALGVLASEVAWDAVLSCAHG